jgi:hypothetical protein
MPIILQGLIWVSTFKYQKPELESTEKPKKTLHPMFTPQGLQPHHTQEREKQKTLKYDWLLTQKKKSN